MSIGISIGMALGRGGGSGVGVAAPVNSVLPAVTGTAELGATLTTTDGTWSGSPTYTYQWKRGGVNIGGATNNTYVLVSADLGTTITSTVTATNAGGSTSATSAGTAIGNWLLFDRFTTAQAAPLTSPRTCEPGPGTLTLTDTGNKLSISSAKLVSLAATSAFSNPKVVGALLARVAGRALLAKAAKGTSFRLGYGASADNVPRGGPLLTANALYQYDNASGVGPLVVASGTTAYDLLAVQQDYNAWTAVKGGAWSVWTLLFSGGFRATDPLTNGAETQKIYADVETAWEVDDLVQWDLGGQFGRSFLWGQGNIEPDPTGVTMTSAADLFATVEYSPAAAATFELSIRRTDDNNRWIVRGDQAANTLVLVERNAGVETTRISGSVTWGTSDKTRVWVRAEGTRISIGADISQKGVYTSASFNQTATGVKVTATNGTAFANLRAIPLAVPALPTEGFSSGLAPLNIFAVGDSKTDGVGGDTTPPFTVKAGFPRWLCDQVEQATARGCYDRPLRIGRGGAGAVAIDSNMTSDLTTRNHVPDYILVNVGANDASGSTAQAAFETAYGSFLDKLHTKWASTPIYCMRVWVRNFASACNSIDDTWIPNVLATRPWAHLGPDERVFLENGDNGVTYTADGIHPNRAGYILTAVQWKTVLGI